MEIRVLRPSDDRSRFHSGNIELVDAKPAAREFYARYGFIELEPEAGELSAHFQATPMFLGVQKLRAALTH